MMKPVDGKKVYILLLLFGSYVSMLAQQRVSDFGYADYHRHKTLYSLEYGKLTLAELDLAEGSADTTGKEPLQIVWQTLKSLKSNDGQDDLWLERVLSLKMENVCSQEATLEDKFACGEFVQNAKRFALKTQMIRLLEEGQPSAYCELYEQYAFGVRDEAIKFSLKFKPESVGTCQEITIGPIMWDVPYETAVDYVFMFKCGGEELFDFDIGYFFGYIISNTAERIIQDGRVMKLVTNELSEYVTQNKNEYNFAEGINNLLRDFKNNSQSFGKLYHYRSNIHGIPISLEGSYDPDNLNHRQRRRLEKGKPAKSKREIIREFKRTDFYAILTDN